MKDHHDRPPTVAALAERSRQLARSERAAADRERALDARETAMQIREHATTASEEASPEREHAVAVSTAQEALDRLREANEHLVLATVRAQVMSEEADEANRLKDQFLAMVSHELRTPLNVILGWAKMLGSTQLKPDRTAHAVSAIERNAAGLSRQIDDLLDVSRMSAGSVRLEKNGVDLLAVIRSACDVTGPAAAVKGVRIECDCGPAANAPVNGDADRLQQVFVNLLSNAVTFTPSGGHISVGVHCEDAQVHVEVKDTGAGIPAEFLPHVFERFSQASRGSTRRANGLGLGLAIVRQLVTLHGGTVRAESRGEQLGACFTVSLPVAAPLTVDRPGSHVDESGATTGAHIRLDGVRILAVEDNVETRELLVVVLQAAGAVVTAVGSAREALAVFSEFAPDVLISDIAMPTEDGYDFIHRIRALEQDGNRHVPALALTGYAFPEDRNRAMLAGFEEHIAKPVEPERLTAAIADLVAKNR